jgi:hypothetical protein
MLAHPAVPSHQNTHGRDWENFYLPVRRNGRTIALPIFLSEYEREFYCSIHNLGTIHVRMGENSREDAGETIFSELIRFMPFLQAMGNTLQKLIPYDIRTGKIKGRHVLEKLLAPELKQCINTSYRDYLTKNLQVHEISLNEYLETARVCYKAAYSEKIEGLTPLEMYRKGADGRDGGMLAITDHDSRKEFSMWLQGGEHKGSHPFEIVFSWHRHGIHLYPPSHPSPHYTLTVTNYAYAPDFIEMVKSLIHAEIPFRADELDRVLDFLSGETDFTVNGYGEHNFSYLPSREYKEKYFAHIEWDSIKIPEWRSP